MRELLVGAHVRVRQPACMCAQVAELAKGAGAMKTAEVAVSGGFHTPLMQPAREALIKVRHPP